MKKSRNIGTYILLILFLTVLAFPFICMLLNSVRSNTEIMTRVTIIPEKPTLENYRFVLAHTNFFASIKNSLIVTVSVTILNTIIASLSAYAISRFRGMGFNLFKAFTYAFQMIPIILLINPLFLIIKTLGLNNNPLSLIIVYTAITLPLAIWTLKGQYDTISFEIEESALIDGCGRFKTFLKIIVPIGKPALFTAGILTFNYCWGEYMLSSIFLTADKSKTLTTAIHQFATNTMVEWGNMMAAAVLAAIPAFFFLVFAQKYIVSGMTSGAVKG